MCSSNISCLIRAIYAATSFTSVLQGPHVTLGSISDRQRARVTASAGRKGVVGSVPEAGRGACSPACQRVYHAAFLPAND